MHSSVFLRAPLARLLAASCLTLAGFVGPAATPASGEEEARDKKLTLVETNSSDQPRRTPVTREAMKQYLEDLKDRTPRIPLPPLTDEEKASESANPNPFGYESRLRKHYLGDAPNAYLTFGGMPPGGFPGLSRSVRAQPQDEKLSLDYGFKVRMFWIAARANNCQYCLGHQESKLLAVGMTDDEIAALDFAWEQFPQKEQVAFQLAKRLTLQPYLLTAQDLEACRPFYNDLQLIEMLGSIAGNNAINRWKEGIGVPQMRDGGNFGRTGKNEHSSYLTKTSDKFAEKRSSVTAYDQERVSLLGGSLTMCVRPPLERGEALASRLRETETRKPRLPLLDEAATREVLGEVAGKGPLPQWQRLLAHFPVAGKRLIAGVAASQKSDELSPRLQAEIDWVVARQDRAWYLTAIALRDLRAAGVEEAAIEGLDGDLGQPQAALAPRDQALLLVAKNLAASPIVLTDAQVAKAVELAGPRAVAQVINYTCYRAALNRITEAAGLSTETDAAASSR
ncbi:MAG: hypothetical protein U0939_17825 [Pirellulales bacterium]